MPTHSLGYTECPQCQKSLSSEQGVRQHHSKVHGSPLPNRECRLCSDPFYDEDSQREHCPECKEMSLYSDPPDDVDIDEWVELSPNQRHYKRNREAELARVDENRSSRWAWVKNEFLLDAECERCGFDDERAIQFHHTEQNNLDESPLQMSRNMRSKERIVEEFDKSELLCANCHMIEHHSERFK